MEKVLRYKYDFMMQHVFIWLCSHFWSEESFEEEGHSSPELEKNYCFKIALLLPSLQPTE